MTEALDILLTNDDGIDEPGLRALYEALSELGSVTVVAPATNQSAIGRSLSYGRAARFDTDADPDPDADTNVDFDSDAGTGLDFAARDFSCEIPHTVHEFGYAVRGTPCDCVILGAHAFERRPDIVVSGCNPGANIGAYVLSRSGTASAAMEAAFLGIPGLAVSMNTLGYAEELTVDSFRHAGELTVDLVDHAVRTDVFEQIDYLNVNVPPPDTTDTSVEITRPSPVYEMDASLTDGRFELHNRLWEQMADGELPDPHGTDRRAVKEGRVSISPLSVPLTPHESESLQEFAHRFE